MSYSTLAFVALSLVAVTRPVDACTIIAPAEGRPGTDVARLTGTVTGYGASSGSVGSVQRSSGLRLIVDAVFSGGLTAGTVEVYPLWLGADCSSLSMSATELERQFPVGSRVLVRGRPLVWPEARGIKAIAVEPMNGGFVRWGLDLVRTREGDLDFKLAATRADPQFERFEFDRVILTLPATTRSERRSRLQNLAFYRSFRYIRNARTLYRDLLVESGLPQSQQEELLGLFDSLVPVVGSSPP